MKSFLIIIFSLYFFNANAFTTVVTNTNDSGPGSLREAITMNNWQHKIRFDPALIATGSDTIKLNSKLLLASSLIKITGLYNSTDTLYISGQENYQILDIYYCDGLTLDSLCLIDGFTSGNGGALEVQTPGILKIFNSIFRNCEATFGGALYYESTNSCYIDGNPNNDIEINNSTFENCTAIKGGAMYLHTDPYAFYDFTGTNLLYSQHGYTINNTNILNNDAEKGGGIYIENTTGLQMPNAKSWLRINYTTIAKNNASLLGGGVYMHTECNNALTFSQSTLVSNSADSLGAGIFNYSLNITDSIIFTNSTVSDNNSPNTGRAVYCEDATTIVPLIGSIIALNGDSSFNKNFNLQNIVTPLSYNILDDNFAFPGFNNQFASTSNLKLGALKNNGGTTLTMAPLAGSIAINLGNPNDFSTPQNKPILNIREIGSTESNCFFLYEENDTICIGENYTFQDNTIFYNNLVDTFHYTYVIKNDTCDDVFKVNLYVKTAQSSSQSQYICKGDSFTFEDGISFQNIQTNILNYESIHVASNGCDSSFFSSVFVTIINDSIYIDSLNSLISLQDSASYQWYDCNTNTLLPGDTNQIYEPTQNGSYQVKVSKNGCEVFSDCIDVTNISIGISNQIFENLKLYPNPVSKQLILEAENLDFEFSILDITGKEISLTKEKTSGKITFDTQKLSSGVYFLNVKNEASSKMFKFVKE